MKLSEKQVRFIYNWLLPPFIVLMFVVTFFLLSGCVVPEITPEVTVEVTLEVTVDSPTDTPTSVATDPPTPTQEVLCVPNSNAMVLQSTNLYQDPAMTGEVFDIIYTDDEAIVQYIVVHAFETVILLPEYSEEHQSRYVVTTEGDRWEGWIPLYVLPVACQGKPQVFESYNYETLVPKDKQ